MVDFERCVCYKSSVLFIRNLDENWHFGYSGLCGGAF